MRLYFAMTAIESLTVAAIIFGQRSAIKGTFLRTGLTGKNFLLLSFAVFISILMIGLLVVNSKNQRIINRIIGIIEKDNWYVVFLCVNLLILLECVQDLFFISSNIKPPHYFGYLQLLSSIIPYLYFGVLFSIQSIILITIIRLKDNPFIRLMSSIELPWLLGFSGLSLLFIVSHLTGFGFVPNTNNRSVYLQYGHFQPTQAVLLGEQVFIILLTVLIGYLLIQLVKKITKSPLKFSHFDWIIILGIWVLAFQLWRFSPIESNYFTGISGSPNNTVYPLSDAYYFDKEALSLLNKGEFTDRATHVLYSFILAVLHKFRGPDYLGIVGIQIGILALIPVFLYKITSKLHTRFTGILVALLYIIREQNGLQLSAVLSGTVANQLMTEPFGALGAIVFLYLIIEWLQSAEEKNWIPALTGSVIGISLLIRAELLAIVIAASVAALIYLWKEKKRWIYGMIQLWVVTGLIIVPWMSRNYLRNGIFTLDKGSFVQRRIVEYMGSLSTIFNNESQDNGIQKEPVDDLVIEDPDLLAYVPELKDVPRHLISSAWQSLLYLPSSHQPLITFSSIYPGLYENDEIKGGFFSKDYSERYVRSLPYYWYHWNGKIDNRSVLSIGILLLFISIGVWRLWKGESTLVLILPFAFLSHILIWSLAGYSGGRFIKPSDWVSMVFYGIGLVEATFFILPNFFGSTTERFPAIDLNLFEDKILPNRVFTWSVLILSGLLVILGLAPTFSEAILPNKYNASTLDVKLDKISQMDQSSDGLLNRCYIDEINESSSIVLYGKALYPRYFGKDETLEDDRQRSIPDSTNPRLDLFLIGENDIWVSLTLSEPQLPLNHYSDVVILGDYVRNTDSDLKKGYKPYFQVMTIYILELSEQGVMINKVSNSGSSCDS